MNIKSIKIFILFSFFILFLNGCSSGNFTKKSGKFKHNTPLIKGDIKAKGEIEVDKTVEMGPKPVIGDTQRLEKRKKISSQKTRNYLLISDEFKLLKQNVTLNFKNLDYREAMNLMAKMGDISKEISAIIASIET